MEGLREAERGRRKRFRSWKRKGVREWQIGKGK